MSSSLPSEYYLKANDPAHSVMTQGKVFKTHQSAWRWLFEQAGKDLTHRFTVEPVENIYYGSHLKVDFT